MALSVATDLNLAAVHIGTVLITEIAATCYKRHLKAVPS